MLELQSVTKKYFGKTALSDVSFALQPGKTCLLLGPNGSGKTTMMKIIAGLARQSSGAVTFNGEAVGPKTKAHIAYMPTENYFYDYMKLRDAGRFYADFFRDFDYDRFLRTLRDMELPENAPIRKLSSGMAAKLRLALIINRDAGLMMFDEPLNGVDILTRQIVIDSVLGARKEGRAMIISTHLVDELEDVVDTCIFLKDGRIITMGPKDAVCAGSTLKDRYIEVYGHHNDSAEGGVKHA